jgi:cell wall-associated NlpC family hydrolase
MNAEALIDTQSLIDSARQLVGAPYRHQGRDASGVDCIGFLAATFAALGVDHPAYIGVRDDLNYGRLASPEFLKLVERHCRPAPRPAPGVLVMMRYGPNVPPQHCGIIAENGNIIHACARRGQVLEHGYRGAFVRLTHSLWLIPGVRYA